MNPAYYTTMALTVLSLTAGDAEAKRRKKAEAPEPVPAVMHLSADEEKNILTLIYHSVFDYFRKESNDAHRDYNARVDRCNGRLMNFDSCRGDRVKALGQAEAVHQTALDEWVEAYRTVSGLSAEQSDQLESSLIAYKAECISPRTHKPKNNALCREIGQDIFEMVMELYAPPEPAPEAERSNG